MKRVGVSVSLSPALHQLPLVVPVHPASDEPANGAEVIESRVVLKTAGANAEIHIVSPDEAVKKELLLKHFGSLLLCFSLIHIGLVGGIVHSPIDAAEP